MSIKIKYKDFPLTWDYTPSEIKKDFRITVDKNDCIPLELVGCEIEDLSGHGGEIYLVDCFCPEQKDLRENSEGLGELNRFDTFPIQVENLIILNN